jgi:protein involved in polysaccharide export with SLBB domain
VVNGRLGNLVHKNINLKKALAGDATHNLSLSPNDRLLVKRIADYQKIRMVTLTGQVSFPGKYPFRKGEKLSDLIERAGGFTPYAYLRGASFTRERVRQLQQQGLEEMTARMERDLLSAGAEQVSTALSSAEITAKQVELEQKKRFIDLLRQSRATGRMTVRLADAKTLRDSEYDFELEDADTLHVPEKNNAVSVMGSVMSQGSHLYSDQYDYQDYIELTGGYSHYADTRNVYVLKVDGSARRVSGNFIGWSASRARWEMTAYGGEIRTIEPGDTIVVPEKAERIAWLREIKDITTIMMNLAVVAGVIVAAF